MPGKENKKLPSLSKLSEDSQKEWDAQLTKEQLLEIAQKVAEYAPRGDPLLMSIGKRHNMTPEEEAEVLETHGFP